MKPVHHTPVAWALLAGVGMLALGAPRAVAAPDTRALAELHVATTPTGAACDLNGTPQGVTPLTLTTLPPGDYLVRLTKNGFRERRCTVTLGAGARAAIDEALEAERGLVLVHTVPDGARIAIDGADRGPAPLLVTDLPLGSHRARAESPGCVAKEVNIDLTGRAPQYVVITLPSSTATLLVNSEPAQAAVSLDGATQGRTPLTLERVAAGEHRVYVALPGYAPFAETVQAEAGTQTTVNAVLTPVPARLHVVSAPPGARVYLDNALHGEAPITIEDLAPGAYRLRLELAGYSIAGRTVTLDRAEDRTEEVRLESNSGTVELITEPAGVNVFLDGTPFGLTAYGSNATDQVSDPLLLKPVESGPHTLQLTKQGFYGVKKAIDVRKDETIALHETLKRRFIPDFEVITPAGVDRGVLVAVEPDGSVRLEVRPGVTKRIRAKDVKGTRPLKQPEPPDLEEEAPAEAASPPAAPVPP